MKRQDILVILIPALIFVIIWIGLNIYHNYITSTIPETLNIQITPINPTFDTKTIQEIQSRQLVIPVYQLSGSTTVQAASPAASIVSPVQISTSSATTQQASNGGNLTP